MARPYQWLPCPIQCALSTRLGREGSQQWEPPPPLLSSLCLFRWLLYSLHTFLYFMPFVCHSAILKFMCHLSLPCKMTFKKYSLNSTLGSLLTFFSLIVHSYLIMVRCKSLLVVPCNWHYVCTGLLTHLFVHLWQSGTVPWLSFSSLCLSQCTYKVCTCSSLFS